MSERKQVPTKSKIPSPTKGGRHMEERLINQERELRPLGPSRVDNPDAVSTALLEEVQCKAMCWEIDYVKATGVKAATYNGQLGLIRGARITPSPGDRQNPKRHRTEQRLPPSRFEVTPTTALHNVIDYPLKDEYFSACMISWSDPPGAYPNLQFSDITRQISAADRIELASPNPDDEIDALVWKAYDISRGTTIADAAKDITQKRLSFEKIPDTLAITEGMKVGIVVYRTFDIDSDDTGVSLSEADLKKLFGETNSVCVFTGEITVVHDNQYGSFEHSINTYRGCSGAIIFLLDKNQQTEEILLHRGKAVGVHAGGKPVWVGGPRANVGFRI
jgi:hypothetical protein